MADPVALVNAFDRFAAGGAPANIVILSLSNLRGVSSEAVNAGGRVQVNQAGRQRTLDTLGFNCHRSTWTLLPATRRRR
jgi:hypothetical protein